MFTNNSITDHHFRRYRDSNPRPLAYCRVTLATAFSI